MAQKRYTFVLNFGYVESASLSYMPWVSRNKYKDAKEALVDLASFFKEQYIKAHEDNPKACCTRSKEKDPAAAFCSKCARPLAAEDDFDGEEFSSWLYSMLGSTCDGFGEYVEWDPSHRWQTDGGLEGAPNPRFVYQAEWVLAAAAGVPYKDDLSFDAICKARTKSRRESFSCY